MSTAGLPTTRSTLLMLARRRDRVAKGAALLRKKREALVAELFRIARPALDARVAISEEAAKAYELLLTALSLHGAAELEALGRPERNVTVEVGSRMVWGIAVPTLQNRPTLVRTQEVRGVAEADAGPTTEAAMTAFERLVERLIDEAPHELLMEQLGAELARTTRRVHVLEQRLAPRLAAQHAAIREVLDERERQAQVRLRMLARTDR
jgi:V/A-type H+-transporting ATPase subunit D